MMSLDSFMHASCMHVLSLLGKAHTKEPPHAEDARAAQDYAAAPHAGPPVRRLLINMHAVTWAMMSF